jgi:hypothetical protein
MVPPLNRNETAEKNLDFFVERCLRRRRSGVEEEAEVICKFFVMIIMFRGSNK